MTTLNHDSISQAERKRPRIFVVDDDPLQVKMLVNILKFEDYDLIGYDNNIKALDDVGWLGPDLILLDLIMPQPDGFAFCRKLKTDHRTRDIPVIFVTAQKGQDAESEGFKLGAVDYITKPFNPVVIKARINIHLELKRHRDSLKHLVEQRTAERDKSRQQFQDLVEKSMVGIAILQNGQLAYQNPELTRMVDDLGQKVRDKKFDFIHPDHMDTLSNACRKIIDREISNLQTDIQIMTQKRNGTENQYIWCNCRISNFSYQGKDAILINVVDITHTKELEKVLLNRNKMSLLGRVASGLAHEIRNPLTGITSYLYNLEQHCEAPSLAPEDIALIKKIVAQLKIACHRVEAVLKRTLNFSKPTVPKMSLVNINECLTNVISLTEVSMRKSDIQLTRELADDLPTIYGDMAMIEQVFFNLFQNAGRALKSSSGAKRVKITSYASDDNHICVAVSDNGPGVPESMREKIFDPFFTTNSEGTGIGLSIAQRIVTDHNGILIVGSSNLGGALFTVKLPMDKRRLPR